MNYFEPKEAAKRYALGRPFFHNNTIDKVRKKLNLDFLLAKGLDVACGTGLSTKALSEIVKEVYGTDSSEEMLKNAIVDERINYINSTAENQPFPNDNFDIITVCSGIHWFNIDNFFISEMKNTPEFNDWYKKVFQEKYPAPKRNNNYNWSEKTANIFNFSNYSEQNFKNIVQFTKKDLILYFTTQTNITNVIEREKDNYSEVEKWLDVELSQFYEDEKEIKVIYFGNWIKYLQKK